MRIGSIMAGATRHTEERLELRSYSGEPFGELSQVSGELLRWTFRRRPKPPSPYLDLGRRVRDLLPTLARAGDLFAKGEVGDAGGRESADQYCRHVCSSTGLPISLVRSVLPRVRDFFLQIDHVLAAQAFNNDIEVYERGYSMVGERPVGWVPRGRTLSVVAPGNHPAVHLIWATAVAMGFGTTVKPSNDEPFTAHRLMRSLLEAGWPQETLTYAPGAHALLPTLLDVTDRSLVFGGRELADAYRDNARVKVFGPGRSKIVVGPDCAHRHEEIARFAAESMLAGAGRGCIGLSAVVTTGDARILAEAIASAVADVPVRDPMDPTARIAAFRDAERAVAIDRQIDALAASGCVEMTAALRKTPRMQQAFGTTFLLPTVVACDDHRHALFGREYPFPFVTVTRATEEELVAAASQSLAVTLLSNSDALFRALLSSPSVSKVYRGWIPTELIDHRDPHEGLLSEHLFETKAVRLAVVPAAVPPAPGVGSELP